MDYHLVLTHLAVNESGGWSIGNLLALLLGFITHAWYRFGGHC